MAPHSVSVVVSATSANLGCAFDCAGVALNLYLNAKASVAGSPGIAVSCRGVDAEQIPQDDRNLVVQAMKSAAAALGKQLPAGVDLELDNDISIGVGLGSSAAAIVAGTLLGAELCGVRLDAASALRLSLQIESHPDNLAAAIYGGFAVAATFAPSSEAPRGGGLAGIPGGAVEAMVARTPVSSAFDFIAVIPEVPLPTAKARAALPASYSREDVVANLQRTALLTASFFSGRSLAPELFRDRLHQPYRASLVPGIAGCLEYRHAGLAGIFLSGAGSAVMCIVEARSAGALQSTREIAADLVAEFHRHGTAARALLLQAENAGTRVTVDGAERLLGAESPA